MPKNKIKTRKAVAKRFKLTKGGKLMRRGAQNRHLKANRSKRNARRSKVLKEIPHNVAKKLIRLLGK
ncbi:MAG TPA: 50S ribosomal protein L35 [Patescibacteria group bacterium]|nr:50S ribosomal protein L35 [Patescibacteria group bacterium]